MQIIKLYLRLIIQVIRLVGQQEQIRIVYSCVKEMVEQHKQKHYILLQKQQQLLSPVVLLLKITFKNKINNNRVLATVKGNAYIIPLP
jgi:hypothetical protein